MRSRKEWINLKAMITFIQCTYCAKKVRFHLSQTTVSAVLVLAGAGFFSDDVAKRTIFPRHWTKLGLMWRPISNSKSSVIVSDNRELKQPRRRRKRERHLKMSHRVSAIIFQLFKVIMFEKCVLTILKLHWNQLLGHKKTKLNICHHMLTSSRQLQNRSFNVVERTRTSSKCQKMKNARAKRAKILFFIVKYANLSGFCFRRRRGSLSSLMTKHSMTGIQLLNNLGLKYGSMEGLCCRSREDDHPGMV